MNKQPSKEEMITELAVHRTSADLQNGRLVSHNFVLKKCKGKEWGDKYGGFSYCEACRNWAWALGGQCDSKVQAVFQEHLNDLQTNIEMEEK